MQVWIILSTLFAVLQAVMVILSKYIMKNLTSEATLTYMLLIQLIVVILYNTYKGYPVKFNVYSMVGGITFGIANLGLMMGVDKSTNPGLADALMRLQVLFTTLFSVLFLNQKLTNKTIIGMVLAIIGAIMITYTKKTDKNKKEGFKNIDKIPWYIFPLLGGILLSVKDVCGVAAVNNGMEPATFVFSVSLFSSVALMLYNYSITHSFLPQFKNNNNRVETIIELMIAGLSMTVAAYLITHAMPLAPNAGYSKSLSLLSVVLTTGYSVIFLKDKLTAQKLFGVISLIIGCIFVSLFGG